jgi:hypothetical protein
MSNTPTAPTACPLCGTETIVVEFTATTGERDSVICCDSPYCPWTLNEPDPGEAR